MKPAKLLIVVIFIIALLSCIGCSAQQNGATDTANATGKDTSQDAQSTSIEPELVSLTLEELSAYDGQNENPAYIAVDGEIYDVSAVAAWVGGKHQGYFAGKDVTQEIQSISPHGISVLKKLPKVGTIKE